MSGGTKVLFVLLVLQLAAIGVRTLASSGPGASRAAAGAPLVAGVDAAAVAKVEVKDQKGETALLARSGDGWALESSAGYPARAEAAQKVLDKVLGARSIALVATKASSHAGLEVADANAQRTVRLLAADGKELAKVHFGKAASGGAFARAAGAAEVHRVEGAVTWELATSPGAYIDTQLLSFDMAQVQSFSIERRGATPTALERGTDDGWKVVSPVELSAAKEKVEEVLRAASRVWLVKPVAAKAAPEHGVDPAECLFKAKLKDGSEVSLALGKLAPDGRNVYARKGGSEFVVEISEHTHGQIEKEAEFFRPAPPPAPAPPPGAGAPGSVVPLTPGAPPPSGR
jgi:hypothetical protein